MQSNDILGSVDVIQTEIPFLVIRYILFSNGLVGVDGAHTTGAAGVAFVMNI